MTIIIINAVEAIFFSLLFINSVKISTHMLIIDIFDIESYIVYVFQYAHRTRIKTDYFQK